MQYFAKNEENTFDIADFLPVSHYISELVKDSDIITMKV